METSPRARQERRDMVLAPADPAAPRVHEPEAARVLLVSNRLPLTVEVDGDRVRLNASVGGLATGLRGPHLRRGGLWFGWPGNVQRLTAARRADVKRQLDEARAIPIALGATEVKRYYEGFANGVLWPLFHYLVDRVPHDTRDWDEYRKVNERFADLVAEHHRPGDLIWVHDYQLLLVPQLLRRRLPEARIGFFLHIPFPASEVFRVLPWRREILEGMLGADLIGFHTLAYVRHFTGSLLRLLGLETDVDRIYHDGREIRLGAFPMGVDAAAFARLGAEPAVDAGVASIRKDAAGQQILLGIDRLDYTKGIPPRLLAVERLLEREPSLRGRLRYIQQVIPSRTSVGEYDAFRRRVNELVGRINGACATPSSVPIHYLYRALSQGEVVTLYRAADVMLVTPLRDGMNLVAKEFIASRTDGDGVLVLSEFVGAAVELGAALQVNPYDVEQMALTIAKALQMPVEERRHRMHELRQSVSDHDVHGWAESFLGKLERARDGSARQRLSKPAELAELTTRLRGAAKLLLLLDYDGTLVPIAPTPARSAPDGALRDLLQALAARAEVHLISGRDRASLEHWFGALPIGLHAEHGLWSRPGPGAEWSALIEIQSDWKDRVRPILEQWAACTPGSFLEEKDASLAWHYRLAEAEFGSYQARELRAHLSGVLSNLPVEVFQQRKHVEVRHQGIHKGAIVAQLLDRRADDLLPVALGDDRTDEDLFAALPGAGVAIHVGPAPSSARFRLLDPEAACAFLRGLL